MSLAELIFNAFVTTKLERWPSSFLFSLLEETTSILHRRVKDEKITRGEFEDLLAKAFKLSKRGVITTLSEYVFAVLYMQDRTWDRRSLIKDFSDRDRTLAYHLWAHRIAKAAILITLDEIYQWSAFVNGRNLEKRYCSINDVNELFNDPSVHDEDMLIGDVYMQRICCKSKLTSLSTLCVNWAPIDNAQIYTIGDVVIEECSRLALEAIKLSSRYMSEDNLQQHLSFIDQGNPVWYAIRRDPGSDHVRLAFISSKICHQMSNQQVVWSDEFSFDEWRSIIEEVNRK